MCPFETMLAEPCLEYDFVESRTHDGRAFRMLVVINKFGQECLAIQVPGVKSGNSASECPELDEKQM